MDVLIVSAIFALVMIGLSIRANARFRQERKLPMQWRLSRSEPLSNLAQSARSCDFGQVEERTLNA